MSNLARSAEVLDLGCQRLLQESTFDTAGLDLRHNGLMNPVQDSGN